MRTAPMVCPEESPLVRPQAHSPASLVRRLPEGGAGGERREARAQWAQPPKAVSDPEFRQTTSGAHGSAGRADCLPRGKPPACSNNRQLCRKKFPLAGLDAPTPAPEEGLQPSWGTHLLRRRSEGGAGGRAESHPASMTRDNFAVRNSPLRGLDAPTPARGHGLQPYGALSYFRRRSEGVQGGTKGSACPVGTTAAGG